MTEDAAKASCLAQGILCKSVWCRAVGATWKHQLHRASGASPGSVERAPWHPTLALRGPCGPCFGPSGELWVAEYHGRCITKITWNEKKSSLQISQRIALNVAVLSTAASVAVSANGAQLAVAVQPHCMLDDGEGEHSVHTIDAVTGRTLLDFSLSVGNDDERLEYPSGLCFLQQGVHEGDLAIADFNRGRVQIRRSKSGELLCMVDIPQRACVSDVAQLAGGPLVVVPYGHPSILAVMNWPSSVRQRQQCRYLTGKKHLSTPTGVAIVGATIVISDARRGVLVCIPDERLVPQSSVIDGRAPPGEIKSVNYTTGAILSERESADHARNVDKKAHRFTPSETGLGEFWCWSGVACDYKNGDLVVADASGLHFL
ncbi:hypothetical protein CYMTET_40213 [Cymbomonas tetramitiformis]|uniref:Uncharacterized protein n=1 Tax=Cymbomonas tetramitiformis TaxID=36881 RepID=A0AAE0C8H5_9CHLO|nr:hypothetical protein CYMTET_40213 [Cymbomonas tetramitiformis]